MNLVAAIFDRMGVPPGPLRLQEQTFLRVVHFLKTGFGTSMASYTSDALHRIYGVGQGSKAGPVTWAAVSSVLFEAQDLLGVGLSFQNPTRTISHKRHSDGFVNDTTGYHSQMSRWLRDKPTITNVFQGLRSDAQTWERLLWTSGGLLELSKCRFYIVYWRFDHDGIGHMLSKDELSNPPLLLTEGNTGNLREVDQLDLLDSFKTLGIHKTVSGDESAQISAMQQKSDAYARGHLSVNVTNFEAWTGLFTIWLGQLNYPLVATSLTHSSCKIIQSKAINASLTKCGGFSRKTSRAVVFGSPWFGGLGWRHLYYEQGILHVLLLIKHLRTPGPFHSLLQICLHWYQLVAGVYLPSIRLNYLDSEWLDSTRLFLCHCSAQLVIREIPLPQLQRDGDVCLMDRPRSVPTQHETHQLVPSMATSDKPQRRGHLIW